MATILLIGEDPDLLRPEDHPPGVTADGIRKALTSARDALRAKGHTAEILWTTTVEAIESELAGAVRGGAPEVIVVGAGLRVLPPMAHHFERLMNAIREHAPRARLGFNTRPDDTAEAAERQLG